MKGCEHNIERTILHRPSAVESNGKPIYVPGDQMFLVCPHGCPDILLNIVRVRGEITESVARFVHNNGRKS